MQPQKYKVTLTLPIAISPLSKKKTIPKNEKKIPNPVNPSPISVSKVKCNYWVKHIIYIYS